MSCDLCGGNRHRVLAEPGPNRHRTLLCERCGLVFAAPPPGFDLEGFIADEFDGDPASSGRLVAGALDPLRVLKQEQRARGWALPLLEKRVSLAGLRVLELRCRSAALAELMAERGAEVVALDPLEENVRHARRRAAGIRARQVTLEQLETLAQLDDACFDLVTGLTVHVPAHLRSPSRLFANALRVLRPGGLLLLDEKNILACEHATTRSIFDSGRAHLYHLCPQTLTAYLLRAGFELLACEEDFARRSAFRHMVAVARRPARPARPGALPRAAPEAILKELRSSQRRLQRRRLRNRVGKALRRVGRGR